MLQIKNVTKVFNLTGNQEDTRVALDNVSLTIPTGQFVTIIGGNGSGKSTLMNIISGVLKPTNGQVLINGTDITPLPEHKRANFFGRVFQDPMRGTSSDMTVLENLEIAYRRGHNHSPFKWGFNKESKATFIKELQRFNLGLETRLNQKVGLMSGGQRQALTLLMATLINKPSYMSIRNSYINFSNNDPKKAKDEFDLMFKNNYQKYLKQRIAIKTNKSLKRKEKQNALFDAKFEFDKSIRQYDNSKQILLLDEHTAALDPKTAKKVLQLTNTIVRENNLTTIMITHNMKDAITYGDRLIMFSNGHIVYDVSGQEKQNLKPEDLLKLFGSND